MSRAILNNVDHHDLKIAPSHGAEFGDAVNQLLVFPTEFAEIQREYPILFRRGDDSKLYAVAILGLDRAENLFLRGGRWDANYVPAIQARGPFSIVMTPTESGDAEPMIHVDLDDPRIGREEGLPLFLPQGGNAPYLEHVAAVLRTIHTGLELAEPFYAALDALDLVEPVTIEISLNDAEKYTLPNHLAISSERLSGLGGDALEQLSRSGFLMWSYLALASLGNVARLIDMKNKKRSGG